MNEYLIITLNGFFLRNGDAQPFSVFHFLLAAIWEGPLPQMTAGKEVLAWITVSGLASQGGILLGNFTII